MGYHIVSKPYKTGTACERCVFGSGVHSKECTNTTDNPYACPERKGGTHSATWWGGGRCEGCGQKKK